MTGDETQIFAAFDLFAIIRVEKNQHANTHII